MPNNADMDAPVTRRELREEFAKFDERFDQKLDQKLAQFKSEIIAEFKRDIIAELSAELARHVAASAEQSRSEMRAVDDQYKTLKTLPPRVEKLEERVFAPPPPAPKRAGRKAR